MILYTQYATRITQGFLFHSITYATPNENNLLTVGYNGLGVSRLFRLCTP
ncbi:MAG: hypothetical protein ACLT76_06345 [Clostridium fessum]